MDDKNRRIKELEQLVEQEKMEQKKQLDLLDQEVILISSRIIPLKMPKAFLLNKAVCNSCFIL